MITLEFHKHVPNIEEKISKPSTIYAQAEVFTSASFSATDLKEELTEEEKVAQSKILRRNERIRLKNITQKKYNMEHEKEEEVIKNEELHHKSPPSFKKPIPFPSFKPLVKNFFIVDKQRNDTVNHL